MASFISALDKHMQPKQFGEKGHVEFSWTEDKDQLIVQFFFQLVRTKDTQDLQQKLRYLLTKLCWDTDQGQLTTLFKLIAQTRDIVSGKGEYNLAFMQLAIWWEFYPDLAVEAFKLFVKGQDNPLDHQYGSWKDIKYMCLYLKENDDKNYGYHIFIDNIIDFASKELLLERNRMITNPEHPVSLIGRWLPREKSKKFGWIHGLLAERTFPPIYANSKRWLEK